MYLEVFFADGLSAVEGGEVDCDPLADGLVPDVGREVARLAVLALLLCAGVHVAAVGARALVALVVRVVVAEHDVDATRLKMITCLQAYDKLSNKAHLF